MDTQTHPRLPLNNADLTGREGVPLSEGTLALLLVSLRQSLRSDQPLTLSDLLDQVRENPVKFSHLYNLPAELAITQLTSLAHKYEDRALDTDAHNVIEEVDPNFGDDLNVPVYSTFTITVGGLTAGDTKAYTLDEQFDELEAAFKEALEKVVGHRHASGMTIVDVAVTGRSGDEA